MLDFVAVAMLAVTVVLAVSVYIVRVKKNPSLHRTIQITTAIILILALIGFEVDVRFFTRWRELAEISPYYESGFVDRCLFVHLLFAIPTPFVWGAVIFMGLKRFKTGFEQGNVNRTHRIQGRIAAGMMVMTAVTGWFFYYVAFVAV